MKKNKKWLKEEIKKDAKKYPHYHDERDDLIKMMASFHDVIALIDQLEEPEQEKVVVPQFVADYIEKRKQGMHWLLGAVYRDILTDKSLIEIREWCWKNTINHNSFASAYITGDYTIEKEKRYTACFAPIGTRQGVYLYRESGSVKVGDNMKVYDKSKQEYHLTEQEIRNRDERFWAFAEELTK